MVLGPVFRAELMALSRRWRSFAGRTLYGLLVLIIVTLAYSSMTRLLDEDGEIPIERLATIGLAIFTAFAWLQGLIILAMTPALVAGSIADEKQRKTLHYLMASQLSSTEIVLGKAAARLLRLGVLGAIGLPVLSLIGLFGGVDYEQAAFVYAGTITTTFFLASIAILCSVHAARPRDAIVQTYVWEFAWLAVPPIILATLPFWSPGWQAVGEFCRPALEWIALTSPTDLLRQPRIYGPIEAYRPALFWMMGAQVVAGAALLIIATLRLRPAYRGMDGPGWLARAFRRGGAGGRRGRLRIWRRPPIGADAMLWKELHLQRIGDVKRILLLLLCAAALGVLITTAADPTRGAIREVMSDGYWAYGPSRQEINVILRGVNSLAMIVLVVGLGTVAASSISSEREGDTWINLAASPVEGPEFIRAKILGAAWVFRPVGYLLGVCWGFALLVGAVHPVGLVLTLLQLASLAWFDASLGVWFSLRSKNTIRAMGATIGVLLFSNAGYLFFLSFLTKGPGSGQLLFMGCQPFLLFSSVLGGDELTRGLGSRSEDVLVVCVVGALAHGLGALILTAWAIADYDRVVDRPDRARGGPTPDQVRAPRPPAAVRA